MLFAFLCFLLMISLFVIPPKHSAEVLSSVPKRKKALQYLTENIHVLGKLCSGIMLTHEFNVNESAIYINCL